MIRKINALLAKAEGTDNEAEASAFFEKAHELMLRYMINEEELRHAKGAQKASETPITQDWEFAVHDAHAKGKVMLLNVVAKAHHVKFLRYTNTPRSNMWRGPDVKPYAQWGVFIGYERDIERAKVMYTSLLVQWARFVHKDFKDSWMNKREEYAFRTGHLVGFATRISARYREIESRVLTTATSALMVNVDAEVDAFYRTWMGLDKESMFCPEHNKAYTYTCSLLRGHEGAHKFTVRISRARRGRAVDSNGYYAGQRAADNADLGQTRIGTRPRLGSGN